MGRAKDYQTWLAKHARRDRLGHPMEPFAANPDQLPAEDHEPTTDEDYIRFLVDHPVERLRLFGVRGDIVFTEVFLHGRNYRATGKKMGVSRTIVGRIVNDIRLKITHEIMERKRLDDI